MRTGRPRAVRAGSGPRCPRGPDPASHPGAAGGLAMFLAFPGHDLIALAVLGPAALAVAVHG
ncbi:apolipoprotein N-acyltransferase, partial [Blastococcus sp. MG754427]|nr:apolipoprotein N-acyltransferase [Blastococcus sp. MG754427]